MNVPASLIKTVKFDDAPLGAVLCTTLEESGVPVIGFKALWSSGAYETKEGILVLSGDDPGTFRISDEISPSVAIDLDEVAVISVVSSGPIKTRSEQLEIGNVVCDCAQPQRWFMVANAPLIQARPRRFICVRSEVNGPIGRGDAIPHVSSPIKIADRFTVALTKTT